MKKVLLVVPPYHPLTSPALGASLLKASLSRLGVQSDVLYMNLRFCEFAGRPLYEQLVQNSRALVGDWVFAEDLFGGRAPSSSDYVRRVLVDQLTLGSTLAAEIEALRGSAATFLDALMQSIHWDDYAIVAISPDFSVGENRIQNCPSLAFLRRVKALCPETATVMAGINCQGTMGVALHELLPFLDYVSTGESERTLPALMTRLLGGDTQINVPGVLARSGTSLPAASVAVPMVLDLDSLPYPDYDDYFDQLAAADLGPEARPYLLFETSRGCWWGEKHHCTFCGLNGAVMQFRSKSPQRALDELDFLVQRHNVRAVFATDMILDTRYFETFLATLASRPLSPSLFFEIKANLTKEQLRILARAGVREIQPGIESLSTPILVLMDKGVTALQNVRLLKWCAEIGIDPFWNILYGFPGENALEYQAMADLVPSLAHLAPPGRILQIRIDRFSPNFDESESRGFINVRPVAQYLQVYPFSSKDLERLAYYFEYDYADGRDPASYTVALRRAVERWGEQGATARLELHTHDDVLEIEDTRPAALRSTTTLRGPARLAYLALDAGLTVRGLTGQLRRTLGREAPATEQVERWLKDWLAARFVMREGPRYLSLATNPAERVELPSERFLAILSRARSQHCGRTGRPCWGRT